MAIISSVFIGKAKKSVGGKAGGTYQHYYGKTVLKQRILNTLNSTQPTAAQTSQRDNFGAVTAVLGAFGSAWARDYFTRSMYGSSFNNFYKLNYKAALQLSATVADTKDFSSILNSVATGAFLPSSPDWRFFVSYGKSDVTSDATVTIDSAHPLQATLSGTISSTSPISSASLVIIAKLLDGSVVTKRIAEDPSIINGQYVINLTGTSPAFDSAVTSVMIIPFIDNLAVTQSLDCVNHNTTKVNWYAAA